jgi:hypothetical protein
VHPIILNLKHFHYSVAPTITSIACNRVFFALRGLYFNVGGGEDINRTGPQSPRFFSYIHAKLCSRKARENPVRLQVIKKSNQMEENLTKDMDTNYEYDHEIAVTRNDTTTKDTSASSNYRMRHRDHHEERGEVGSYRDGDVVNKEVHVTATWENNRTGWTHINLV